MFPGVTTTDNPSSNELNVNLISILHNVLDKISKSFENNDIDLEHHVILVRLFQSLELLYNNITLTPEQATEVNEFRFFFLGIGFHIMISLDTRLAPELL